MPKPSEEQLRVICAPIAPMSVIACAGSGKTYTAVRRLAWMRRQLGSERGRVALLSFSNVAVETFRREYQNLARFSRSAVAHGRVEIDTLDSFITANVLRPHAYRTMGARQAAFLVAGGEAFLSGFKFNTKTYPRNITEMQVGIDRNGAKFFYSDNDRICGLGPVEATRVVHRLGQAGAYTHNLGRYWCYRTLAEQPGILRALVRRYPHILVDEAQDIGTAHQAIIEQLVSAGCQVSLIGDPNQGIYEYAGANGAFLTQYGHRDSVNSFHLTRNFRSVPAIVGVANRLSTREDTADSEVPATTHGAFFVPYRNAERDDLISAFETAARAADLSLERSAVLCRAREMANRLVGKEGAPGQGTVKDFVQAAILRDRYQDYLGAFKLVASGIVSLVATPPQGLVAKITQPLRYPDDRALRRLVWTFTRNSESGLPAATLTGDSQWHSLLLERTRALLAHIAQNHGLGSVGNLGNRLARRGLPNAPLIAADDLTSSMTTPRVRVDTVHQAKGESLDAVLYLMNREHANALLAGVDTELGRIGYVAVTRARYLLWVGVPANALADLRPTLLARGFQEVRNLPCAKC